MDDIVEKVSEKVPYRGGRKLTTERVIGAPGTGKTKFLMDEIAELVKQGAQPEEIGLFSFSKASNREAVQRAAALFRCEPEELSKDGYFRTVHSSAFRLLDVGEGELLTDNKESCLWISEQFGEEISTKISDDYNVKNYVGGDAGRVLNIWELARTTLRSFEETYKEHVVAASIEDAKRIVDRYESAKRIDGRLDFTDLLLRFAGVSSKDGGELEEIRPEGELPDLRFLLFDEYQDTSALIERCCRRFLQNTHTEKATFVGDPFQSIYGFAGSSPEFLMNMEVDSDRVMPRSYRCPREVMDFAEDIIRRQHRGYFERNVEPAEHKGGIQFHVDPELALADVNPREDTLVLARSHYRKKELACILKNLGVPFGYVGTEDGPSVTDVACTALHTLQRGEPVEGAEFARVVEKLPINSSRGKIMERGVRSRWKKLKTVEEWDVVFPDDLPDLGFTEEASRLIASGQWPGLVNGGNDWANSVRDHGVELTNNPKVKIGTCHSTKGEEAENVFFWTATSNFIHEQKEANAKIHDEELRVAYVAATRARKNLHIIETDGTFGMLD